MRKYQPKSCMKKYLVLIFIIVLISGLSFISYSTKRGLYISYSVFSEALNGYTFLRNSIFERKFTLTVKSDPAFIAKIQVYSGRWCGGYTDEKLVLPFFSRRVPVELFPSDCPARNSFLVAEKNLNASGNATFRLPQGDYYVVALVPFLDAYVLHKYPLSPPWLDPTRVFHLDKDREVTAEFPVTDYPPI